MEKFDTIKRIDMWEHFVDSIYVHHKFNIFLKIIKGLKGNYFDNTKSFLEEFPHETYTGDFIHILYLLKMIHDSITPPELWVDKNIDIIESHKDIINIVNNEIDINQFIRRKKLKHLKDAKK